jgi:M6 family metalloprotease-like protein/uncharacterized repeat protein (TIGR02543 family)
MKKISALFVLILTLVVIACTPDGSYKIEFEMNGGIAIQSIEFSEVYALEMIEDLNPQRPGHTFDAWYLDVGLTEANKLDADITSSVTLYAKWIVNQHTITFNLDGGTLNPAQVISFTIFDSVALLEPSKEGYRFDGWYVALTDQNSISTVVAGTSQNLSFTAKWTDISQLETFTIEFRNFDGTLLATYSVLEGTLPVYAGQTPVKAADAIYTYEFVGWDQTIVVASENAVYIAVFVEILIEPTTEFDKDALNAIFGFDIYALLPAIVSSDALILNESDEAFYVVYINIFTWTETDADNYDTLLFDSLAYDELEESYILGEFFVYVYIDDITYEGLTVYGIGIYGPKDGTTPVDPETKPFDSNELNAIFGFNIYALMPSFVSAETIISDVSDTTYYAVYIDIFTWTEADADQYEALLNANLTYDAIEESYVLGDFFIYVFSDDQTYEGLTVYGIGIYGDKDGGTPVDPEEPDTKPFDKNDLNAIFGFDIYALLPAFSSTDVIITDFSDETFFEVYIDIFTWSETDADIYDDLLFNLLSYDASEDSYIVGGYYIYVFIDQETYEGLTVFGIGIYGDKQDQTPIDPVDGLYLSFNVQNTTSTLPSSYSLSNNVTLDFPNNNGLAVITASHVANITQTAPSGLSLGKIFAANVSGNANPMVYLEVNTLGNIIDSMSFEIEARNNFSTILTGAKLQVLVGSLWTDLTGGNFYSQISEDKVLITINNINASRFRLLFQGTGATSNGGQFMIGQVNLYQAQAPAPVFELWSDVVTDLEAKFDDQDLNIYLPAFEGLTDLIVNKISNTEYVVLATTTLNTSTLYTEYVGLLLNKGFVKDDALSALRSLDIYVYVVNDDIAYAVYIEMQTGLVEITIYSFDAVIDEFVLQSLSPRQSINEYEVSKFGVSGLPSVGSFDVLVIPVEIYGVPFDTDYLTNLEIVFNGTSLQTGWESVSSFYYKSSYGKLDLNFDIVPKYVTNNPRSFYEGKGSDGDQFVIKEALLALDSSIDFSKYDFNNDGTIDSVIFIYSADYNYDVDPWWAWVFSARFGEASKVGRLDGKDFEYYFWASYTFIEDEISGNTNLILNAETYIHELGHLMGIVDFYPYEGNNNYGPMGGFDMMDYNAGDHGPFNKLVFGWLEPLLAQKGTYQVTLDSFSLDTDGLNNTILIPYNANDLNDGNAFDEYLLIMFYTPNGLYQAHRNLQYIPTNAGIVIYHIDARLNNQATFWGEYFLNDNEGSSNFINQILEADKNNSMPGNTPFRQSDLLTSGTLNLNTYQWNQGGAVNVSITVDSPISNNSTTVTLTLSVS